MSYLNQRLLSAVAILVTFAFAMLFGAGVYIGLFNDLTFDDIARKTAGNWDIIGAAKAFYNGETGRFTNGLITQYSGLYELTVYRKLHIVLGAMWVFSTWLFYGSVLRLFNVQDGRAILVLAAPLLATMIANAPNLGEWWFWYTTASLYLFGLSLLLLGLHFLIRALETNALLYWLGSGSVLFFAGGNSEMVLFAALAITALTAAIKVIMAREWKSTLPLIFCLVATIMIVLSPGNAARQEMVSEITLSQQVAEQFSAIPAGVITTLVSALKYWTMDSLWLLLMILTLLLGWSLGQQQTRVLREGWLYLPWLAGFLVLLVQAVLVVLMDWKININDPSRTSNFAYIWFLITCQIGGLTAGLYVGSRWQLKSPASAVTGAALMIASGLWMFALYEARNTIVLADDLRLNKPRRQAESIALWDLLIQQGIEQDLDHIVVPNMIPANSLTVYRRGPAANPDYPMNSYWRSYKNIKDRQFSRTNFDQDLRQSLLTDYQPLTSSYRLLHYRDQYRHYAVVQVPQKVSSEHKFCLEAIPDNGMKYQLDLRDENFARLEFKWRQNQLCTRFGKRRMFCERHDDNWLCRIPLPRDFTGQLTSQWGPESGHTIAVR